MRSVAALGALLLFSGVPGLGQAVYSASPGAGAAGMEQVDHGSASLFLSQPTTTICTTTLRPAQDKAGGTGPTATVCRTVAFPSCPVAMQVRQGIGGGMLAVDKNGRTRTVFAPRLRLFLNDARDAKPGRQIVSATVIVHGSGGKEKILPVDAEAGAAASLEKTFTVNLANWGEPGVSGDFRLPGFVSTTRVDLKSVTYDDGSTWNLSGAETCRVAPDPLMLVSR